MSETIQNNLEEDPENEFIVGCDTTALTDWDDIYDMELNYSTLLFEAEIRDVQQPELCRKVDNELPHGIGKQL